MKFSPKNSIKTLIIRFFIIAAFSFVLLYFFVFQTSDLSIGLSFMSRPLAWGLILLLCLLIYGLIAFRAWKRSSIISIIILIFLSLSPVAFDKFFYPYHKKERFRENHKLSSNVEIFIFHDDHGGWLGDGTAFCLMKDEKILEEVKSETYRPLPFSPWALKLMQHVQGYFDVPSSDMPDTIKDNLFFRSGHNSVNAPLHGTVEVISTNRYLKWYFDSTM